MSKPFRLLRYQLRISCRLDMALTAQALAKKGYFEGLLYSIRTRNADYTARYPFWTDGLVWF